MDSLEVNGEPLHPSQDITLVSRQRGGLGPAAADTQENL